MRTALAGAVFLLGCAVLTLCGYLARAGGTPERNWPTSYNLTSSDNGVLFQVARDLFAGVPLDWSFSPQVYVFPELPMSIIAFAVTGGSLAWYYPVVAMLNSVALVAALWWLVRLLFGGSRTTQFLRTAIAGSPLLVLPVLSQQTMFVFHLAPTYYFGMYLFALLLPAAFLTQRRWARIAVVAGWALTGAANPLLFAMTLPGAAAVLLLRLIRRNARERRSVIAVWSIAGALVGAFLIRVLVFNQIAGTDPTNYISFDRAVRRMHDIEATFTLGFRDGVDQWLIGLTIVSLAACLVLLVVTVAGVLRQSGTSAPASDRQLVLVFLSSLPFLGALAMTAILAVHVYYLWFMVVGSVVIAALLLPPRRLLVPLALGIGVVFACSLTVAVSSGNFTEQRYFGYRSELSQCLDETVPAQIGYSTFSDARSNELPAHTGIRLISLNPDLSPSFWLTNRAYSKTLVGTFILINPATAEPPLRPETVRANWGEPAAIIDCAGAEIWTYPANRSGQRIAEWFTQFQSLR